VWTRYRDEAGDEWYVSPAGEAAWTLPPGDTFVEGASVAMGADD